jgi:opacity protein-like surface antigen
MRQMDRCFYTACAVLLFSFFLAPRNSVAAATAMRITQEFDARWAYVGDATIRGGGARFDSGAEQSSYVRYVFSPQVTSRLLLHFGAEWQRFSFGVPDPAPVPGTLQQVSMVIGLDWQFTDRWLLRAEVQPGVYSDFRDVSWKDLDAPIFLGAVYLANPDLQWFLGVRLGFRSNYPVIPAVGARWKFADDWTLNAVLPRPRLEYDRNERFKAYLGAGIEAGTFRIGDKFGDDQGWPELNRAILDYFEIRIGPGFSWKIRPNISVEADAGYMLHRRFDFADQKRVFRSDPAPYVQIACQVRF